MSAPTFLVQLAAPAVSTSTHLIRILHSPYNDRFFILYRINLLGEKERKKNVEALNRTLMTYPLLQ